MSLEAQLESDFVDDGQGAGRRGEARSPESPTLEEECYGSMTVIALRPWQRVLAQVSQALRAYGLDVTAPLSVEWYNSAVSPALHLPWLGRDQAPLAILVGNSKAIWEPFKSALRTHPSLLDEIHPLDAYVRQVVTSALSSFHLIDTLSPVPSTPVRENGESVIRAAAYWDHDTRPGRLVAMQRLACIAGVAYLNEAAHLCVHTKLGSWFALRAVVLFEVDPPTERPEVFPNKGLVPFGHGSSEQILEDISTAEDRERVGKALTGALDHSEISKRNEEPWRRWLAVRDAINPGHPMRYSGDQIEYHYTHNKDILVRVASQES